jgi:hypothetical protein
MGGGQKNRNFGAVYEWLPDTTSKPVFAGIAEMAAKKGISIDPALLEKLKKKG